MRPKISHCISNRSQIPSVSVARLQVQRRARPARYLLLQRIHRCLWGVLLGLLLSINARSGQAQVPAGTLTLDDCIHLAESAPSSVRRARQQAQIAKYGITSAHANFLPQLSIYNGITYNSPLLYDRRAFSFIALNGIREYTTLVSSFLEIDTSGRLRAILARAHADRDAANVNLELSARDLKLMVSASYYRVLLARKLAGSAQDNLHEAETFEDRVRLLVKGGEASQADLAKASLETAVLENALTQAELEVQLANHDLASFWTTDVDTPLQLEDVLEDMPATPEAENLNMPYLKRPEFKLFDAQADGYLADAHLARAQLLPHLNLSFEYGIDATQVAMRDRGYAGFVNLEVPVFDWFRARSEGRQFQQQAQQTANDKDIAKRVFSKEYQDALAAVNSLYVQISVAERQVKYAKENLHLSRLRYEGGEGLALDVVTAQTQLAQAQIAYYTTRANYLDARATLDVASGR